MLPSSVPATNLENNGARISVMDMIGFVEKHPRVLGLGEVMNYPDIINGDHDSIAKIELLRHKYKKIDGHIPGISGKDLNAYICAFIRSDHECTNVEEAKEKLARGMQILVREGSVARNLDELLPLINEKNYPFISFCTDDKHPNDILNEGHIDYMIRYAIKKGIDPITAVRAATINTARHYNLRSMGAIAPGYKADFVIVDNLEEFRISMVFKDSKLIAENGKLVIDINREQFPLEEVNTFKCPHIEEKDLEVLNKGENIRVIRVYGDDVLTKELRMEPKTKDGRIVSDVNRDILKVASICRYCEEKSMAIGFINGTGLKQGAVATSVGHDAHNMSVIGTNDADMVVAANRVIDMGGGLVIANSGKVLAELPLPIAGLMSNLSSKEVAERLGHLKTVLKELGCEVPDLFMTLSFVQLSVIPELRITNQGLVDVINNNFVSLFIGKEG